jgi:hypothetical protein
MIKERAREAVVSGENGKCESGYFFSIVVNGTDFMITSARHKSNFDKATKLQPLSPAIQIGDLPILPSFARFWVIIPHFSRPNGGSFECQPSSEQVCHDRVEVPTGCRLEPEVKG